MTEKQDFGSPSEAGGNFEALNLSEAKHISTRRQKVKGSIVCHHILRSNPSERMVFSVALEAVGRMERCSILSRAVPERTVIMENFNGKLRDEPLDREVFETLRGAKGVVVERRRRECTARDGLTAPWAISHRRQRPDS